MLINMYILPVVLLKEVSRNKVGLLESEPGLLEIA